MKSTVAEPPVLGESSQARGPAAAETSWPVLYPVDGQTGVPVEFPGNETPNPIPEATTRVAGYPITVTFAPRVEVHKAEASLRDGDGREVEVWFSSPDQPANPRYASSQQNTVCLIPKRALQQGSLYRVSVSARVAGKPWNKTWGFTTQREDDVRPGLEKTLLDRINHYREVAGLKPVVVEANLSQGCNAHARYIALNQGQKSLNWNDEDANLPGYSAEGKQASRTTTVLLGFGPVEAVEWVSSSYFNRGFLLDPSLKAVGVGYARQAPAGVVWALDLIRGRGPSGPAAPAVLFPADGQKAVPRGYPATESPNPIPDEKKRKNAGYLVTARFPYGTPVSGVAARMEEAGGKDVPYWLSTPDQPLVEGGPPSTIALIPQAVLKENTAYTVALSARVGGKAWSRTWCFTTVKDSEGDQEALAKNILEDVNRFPRLAGLSPVTGDARLAQGALLHARYLVRNIDQPAVQGMGMHEEDPKLPGATPEGTRAGGGAVIASYPNPLDCVTSWMSTLYHRVPLLDPRLRKVGFGCARIPNGNWITVLDVTGGRSDRAGR